MAKLGLSSPWVIYYKKVDAMFKYDDEVHVLYDEDKMELRLYVEDTIKAAALEQLLPTAKGFGNLELKITIIPANDDIPYDAHLEATYTLPDDPETLFNMAFRDNEVFSYSKTIKFIFDGGLYPYLKLRQQLKLGNNKPKKLLINKTPERAIRIGPFSLARKSSILYIIDKTIIAIFTKHSAVIATYLETCFPHAFTAK